MKITKAMAAEIATKVVEKKSIKNSITEWVANELNKDTLLEGGYLKQDQKQVYEMILSIFSNLEELKAVVSKLKW